jgi:hypothetical protein
MGDAMALELLARGESITLRVRGRSMWPFVRPGDRVVIAPDLTGLKVGGVALWVDEGGGWRLHRLVARLGPWVWLKGDALPTVDGRVRRDALRGQVVSITRKGQPVAPGGGKAVVFSVANGAARFALKHAARQAKDRLAARRKARKAAQAAAKSAPPAPPPKAT